MPKNRLDAALSAHTCSLSEKVVDDCFEMMMGFFHAAALPAAAARGSSVLETAIASKPLNVADSLSAETFEVRLA